MITTTFPQSTRGQEAQRPLKNRRVQNTTARFDATDLTRIAARTKKKKVLIIDDNAGILFAVKQALEFKDYDVHISESFTGVDAVAKISPHLIYLDISLVGQDGREISRELKGDERTKGIPVIILTAYPNAAKLAKEAGANDYLPKPFELENLWNMTEKYA